MYNAIDSWYVKGLQQWDDTHYPILGSFKSGFYQSDWICANACYSYV